MNKLDLPDELNSSGGKLKKSPMKEPNFKHTVALKPQVEWDGSEVEVTSEVYAEPVADWDTLLEESGYDASLFEVVDPVKVSMWDSAFDGGVRKLYSYKFGVKVKATPALQDADYKDIVELVRKHRPSRAYLETGPATFVICLADIQIGKPDGNGTKAVVERFLTAQNDITNRIIELKKMGREIGKIIILGVGDLVEGCDGHYSTQSFTVELNRREQIRVLRRLLTKAICEWSKYASEVEIYCVPGNHGENRKDYKSYTNRGDNDDVAVFEMVAEILAFNPEAYGHVQFFIPENEVYQTIQVGDRILGLAHGHITGGGADPQKKIKEWWKGHSFGKRPMSQANLLITGHYHHFSVIEYDLNTIHIQCPALDDGSEWYSDLSGMESRPGVLTFVMDSTKPYRDLEII